MLIASKYKGQIICELRVGTKHDIIRDEFLSHWYFYLSVVGCKQNAGPKAGTWEAMFCEIKS